MDQKLFSSNQSIEDSMLGPLWARAIYSSLYPNLLDDPQAVQIIQNVNYDFDKISEFLKEWRALSLLVRVKCFDIAIKEYINKYPNATVINIG